MRLSIKIALLTAIFAADLIFFLFFRIYLPQQYDLVFHSLPWSDNFEKTVAIIVGLATALVTAISISRLVVNRFLKSLERGQ